MSCWLKQKLSFFPALDYMNSCLMSPFLGLSSINTNSASDVRTYSKGQYKSVLSSNVMPERYLLPPSFSSLLSWSKLRYMVNVLAKIHGNTLSRINCVIRYCRTVYFRKLLPWFKCGVLLRFGLSVQFNAKCGPPRPGICTSTCDSAPSHFWLVYKDSKSL